MSRTGKSEPEGRLVVARGWEVGRDGELTANGHRFSLEGMEIF